MWLDANFRRIAESLRAPALGTEETALLLYALVLMLRPRSVLEVGAGYTSVFLARALAEAQRQAAADRELLDGSADSRRRTILGTSAARDYRPHLQILDDLSHPRSRARHVREALERLGLADFVDVASRDFRGASRDFDSALLPFDFIWFDCGAAGESGVDFLDEYWPLVREDGGIIALHSMHVTLQHPSEGDRSLRVPSALLNELRKRQAAAEPLRQFELLCLIEPYKRTQGDVTILRRVGGLSHVRSTPFEEDARLFGGFVGRSLKHP